MEIKFSFENLEVWQLARALVNYIYDLTADFPKHERYGIANQIERSASSVMTNLAEGAYRLSKKEQARFTEIAYSKCNGNCGQLPATTENILPMMN